MVSSDVTIEGAVIVATSGLHRLSTLGPVMLIGGGAWIVFISLVSALVQNLAPDWVRARFLAIYLLVFKGSVALGSAVWGAVAQRVGISTALVCAGIGTIATTLLALFAKLPDATSDLSPWNHWRMPVAIKPLARDSKRAGNGDVVNCLAISPQMPRVGLSG